MTGPVNGKVKKPGEPGYGLYWARCLDAALDAAARGWPVFPCRRGEKRPAVREWETKATTDAGRITAAWSGSYSGCNIGVATGVARLVVVDLDMSGDEPDGSVNLDALLGSKGLHLPETFTVTTPSGGQHHYFRAPADVELRNTAGRLAPKVDTRGAGGYVVAPGSRTARGVYRVALDVPPVPLPRGVLELLLPPPPRPAPPVRLRGEGRVARYVRAAIDGETARVAAAPEGQRNHTLHTAACALGQLVGADVLDGAEAAEALRRAAAGHIAVGAYSATQAEKTIAHGLTYGETHPRPIRKEGAA